MKWLAHNPSCRDLLILALVFGGSCQWDPYSFQYTKTKPNLSDIIGVWEATDETRRFIESKGYPSSDYKVEVEGSGKFQLVDIPDFWRDAGGFGLGNGNLESHGGEWELEEHQGTWGLDLRIEGYGYFSNSVKFLGQSPPYRLKIGIEKLYVEI